MSSMYMRQLTKEATKVPKLTVGLLLGILVFEMFMIGFDEGRLFSLAQDEQAYEDWCTHEFYHDMRHACRISLH